MKHSSPYQNLKYKNGLYPELTKEAVHSIRPNIQRIVSGTQLQFFFSILEYIFLATGVHANIAAAKRGR